MELNIEYNPRNDGYNCIFSHDGKEYSADVCELSCGLPSECMVFAYADGQVTNWTELYCHTRDGLRFDGAPFVQMEKGGEWIPVRDWRAGKYDIDAKTLRHLAKHFIEIGKHIKDYGD